jgi:hypothetical protein
VDEHCATGVGGGAGKTLFMTDDNLAIFSFQRPIKMNTAPGMEVSGA